VFYLSYLLLPALPGYFYSSQRFWFLSTLFRMILSPFIKVEFRDFYIADQLTSLGDFFFDSQFIFCVFPIQSGACFHFISFNTFTVEGFCTKYISIGIPILSLLPFTIRFVSISSKLLSRFIS
jgi:hypothetical protein